MRKRTSVGKWTSPGKQSGKHTYIQRPTVSHRVQFLLRWADEEMQGGRNSWMCVWESLVERVQGKLRLKGTHWAEQKAVICRQFGLSKKNSASPLGGAGFRGIHRPSLRRKKKKAKLPEEEKRRSEKKRSELDLFSKRSHILGSTLACPCQRRVGRGGMREVERERGESGRGREKEQIVFWCVFFLSFFLLPA